MKVSNLLLVVLIGAILLHLFSLVQIPSFFGDDKDDIVVDNTDYYKHKYDSLKTTYEQQTNKQDSIINIYENKVDSIETLYNIISIEYEEKMENIINIDSVSNDSITEYISNRIHNR